MLKCKATGGDARAADLIEVRRALAVLADPQCGIQLQRAPFHAESFASFPGSDLDSQCDWVQRHQEAKGIYYALNPVPLDLSHSLRVGDVLKRRWLLIDVDRDKTLFPDDSATDAEHERAMEQAERVKAHLASEGWPAPIVVDSGNGWHLLYRIDLPNTGGRDDLSRQLVKAVLDALAFRFASTDGSIGTECHDARRIAKLPGTWARRGAASSDRPYRMAKMIDLPETAATAILDPELMRDTVAKIRARQGCDAGGPGVMPDAAAEPRSDTNGFHVEEPKRNGLVVTATADADAEERAIAYLATIPGGVDGHGGSDPAYWAARCMVYGFGLGVERGLSVMMAHYNPTCVPPWPEHQMRHKCEDADTKEFLFQRGWLLEESRRSSGNGAKPGQPSGQKKETLPPLDPNEPLTVCLGSIVPKCVDWLVPNRIAKGFITVFAGQTGIGKSFASMDLIARMTRGDEIPFSGGLCFDPGSALMISEDSHEYVLAPRLMECGADMKRVRAMTWKAMASYDLADTAMLERACLEMPGGVRLLVIDPPTNFLVNADEHKNSEVRRVVMKTVEWIQGKPIAVVFILHINKNHGKGLDAMNRVMGSVAWVTTSRVAHSFSADPDDSTRCLWIPMKNNLGPKAKGLAYRIVKTDSLAKVEWLGEVDTTADEALASEKKEKPATDAEELLRELFKGKKELAATVAWAAANQAKITTYAVKKAIKELGIQCRQVYVSGHQMWIWYWTKEQDESPDDSKRDERGVEI